MEGNRIEKSTDLLRGVTLTKLDRLFAENDNGAHTFIVGVTLGRAAVELDKGATVTGHFIRSDNSTLPPIVGSIVDGKAVLTLPEAAYAITGHFSLIIKATVGEMRCAIFWGDGEVIRSSTDTVVDPDHTIPSLEELLTKIAAIDDAIERADEATKNAEAWGKATVSSTTLSAGSQATVSLRYQNGLPLLTFGLPRGEKGADGSMSFEDLTDEQKESLRGYTPQRGVDYWTTSDIAEIKGYVDDAILNGAW